MKKLCLLGLVLLLSISFVCAAPGQPHRFKGDVTINGAPAPDGTTVTATVDGVTRGGGTTIDGMYGEDDDWFLVSDPDGVYGVYHYEIKFYVKGKYTGDKIVFVSGENTGLDLSVTTSSDSSSDNGGSSGGGGGGGSLGAVDLWDCGEWSDCVDGKQTQDCVQGIAKKTNTRDCELEDLAPGTTSLIPPTPPGFDDGDGAEDDLMASPGAPPITGAVVAGDDESGSFIGVLTKTWLVPILLVVVIALLVLVLVLTGRSRRRVKEVVVKDKPVKPESKRIDPPVADESVSRSEPEQPAGESYPMYNEIPSGHKPSEPEPVAPSTPRSGFAEDESELRKQFDELPDFDSEPDDKKKDFF